jgi:intein/homing endonuclease
MLGNATKIANTLLTSGKEYVCVMRLHQPETAKKIQQVAREFVGTIYQRPPLRSSVKRRLRTRTIYYLNILEIEGQNVLFRVGCQAGTYIRKLCVEPSSIIMLQNGGAKRISDVVDGMIKNHDDLLGKSTRKETLSLDIEGHKLISSTITGVQRLPAPNQMVRIFLESGISFTVTPDHELLVDALNEPTWIEAQNLIVGQSLFAPRKISLKHQEELYILDLLDSNILCVGDELKIKCKSHLVKTYGSVTKACKILGLDRRLFLESDRGIRKKYLQTICENTELDWKSVREVVDTFKGERGKRFRIFSKVLNRNLLYLLGLIASDGCISTDKRCIRPTRVLFHNQEKALIEAFTASYHAFFSGSDIRHNDEKTAFNEIVVDNHILAGVAESLGITSPKKNMQLETLASLPEEMIASFLAGYCDGDGSVYYKPNSNHTNIIYFTKHYHIAKGLFILLKRLGLRSKIAKRKPGAFGEETAPSHYTTRLQTPYDKKQYAAIIQCQHPSKKGRLNALKDKFTRYGSYGAFDRLPLRSISSLKALMKKYGLSTNSVYQGGANRNILYDKSPTRRFISKCVESLSNLIDTTDPLYKELEQMINAPYYLTKVKAIEWIEPDFDFVYDITVNPHHNFILNGSVVVSNCADIGQVLGGGAHMAELRRTQTGPFHGANLAVAGVLQVHDDIKAGDTVAITTLKGELVALAVALLASRQILESTSGIVANTSRVILPTGTYPSAWRKKP